MTSLEHILTPAKYGSFDINKMLTIMKAIDHKWCMPDGDYRIPTYDEVVDTIQFLIDKIDECETFKQGIPDVPMEAAIGGIHLTLTLKMLDTKIPSLEWHWNIEYIPLSFSTIEPQFEK